MRISELFYSIQGEGKLVGMPSLFVRCSGCNLRCTWCDTPYASWNPQGDDWPVSRIIDAVASYRSHHVVITGGEPMIMPDITPLCDALKEHGYHITIETAATIFEAIRLDLASMSPKLSNSTPTEREGGKYVAMHERQRLNLPVIQQFIDSSPDFQLKFVVSDARDLDEIDALLEKIRGWKPQDILLMPEGTDADTLATRAGWITELCKSRGFRYCPRLHVALYGNRRGT